MTTSDEKPLDQLETVALDTIQATEQRICNIMMTSLVALTLAFVAWLAKLFESELAVCQNKLP